jgi:hypothetical protein
MIIIMDFEKRIVRRDIVLGSCRPNNYFFRRILFFGGLSFFLTGVSSWWGETSFIGNTNIQFLPQGLVMCFYGSIRIRLGLYLILRRFFSVGKGFNEYDKEKEADSYFSMGISR